MRKLFFIAMCACGLIAAGDAPYAGKWKMNPAKSNFGDTTVTYEALSGGEMKVMMDGQTFTFKTDGKDYATPWGMSQSWKPIDARTWEITDKVDDKVIATSTLKLSADEKSMTLDTKRTMAEGGTANESLTFQRASGATGLAGNWRTKNLTSSSPETLTLTPKGSDGLAILLGNQGSVCDARFDGKDHPATGTLWHAGWTCTIARNGDRAFDITWKMKGKDMYKTTLSVAPDGKVLTESGSAAGVNEKFTIVYDRQ